jgi:hypothetical protein
VGRDRCSSAAESTGSANQPRVLVATWSRPWKTAIELTASKSNRPFTTAIGSPFQVPASRPALEPVRSVMRHAQYLASTSNVCSANGSRSRGTAGADPSIATRYARAPS